MGYIDVKTKVLLSYSNRLGVLRHAINNTRERPPKRAEEYLQSFYKKNCPREVLAKHLYDHDVQLLSFYFSSCQNGNGGYDQKKFEDEVKRKISLDDHQGAYIIEGDV